MAKTTSAQKFKKLQQEQLDLQRWMEEIESSLVEAKNTLKIELANKVMSYLEIDDPAEAVKFINKIPKPVDANPIDVSLTGSVDNTGHEVTYHNER